MQNPRQSSAGGHAPSASTLWLAASALWLLCVSGGIASAQTADGNPLQPSAASHEPAEAATATTPSGDPPAELQATYHAVVARAVSEFEAGRAAEARALFLRAHELWPSSRTLRTLGMTAFELRQYPRALEELQSALDDPRRPLPDDQRRQVQELIEQARGFVGNYRVQLTPSGAELSIDGAPYVAAPGRLLLTLGEHTLSARSHGYGELRRSLVVQGGEDAELLLSLEPLAPPSASDQTRGPKSGTTLGAANPVQPNASESGGRLTPAAARVNEPNLTPAFIAFGVGGAALVVGVVSGLIALGDKHDPARLEAGHRAADISTVAYITCGVSAAAGTVLLLLAAGDSKPGQAARSSTHGLRASIGLTGLSVEGKL